MLPVLIRSMSCTETNRKCHCRHGAKRLCDRTGRILIVTVTVSRRRENDLTAVGLADLDVSDADAEVVVTPLG